MKRSKLTENELLERNGTKKKIEEYFFSNEDNSSVTMANKFGLTVNRVNLLLNEILNERIKK